MGPLAQMTRQGRLNPEDLLDESGNVRPTTLLRTFQMLRPLGDLTGYVTLWTRMHDRQLHKRSGPLPHGPTTMFHSPEPRSSR
jgi:polyhydroxyalkanoate synthase